MPGSWAGQAGDGHTHTLAWGFFLEKSQARPRSEMRTCPNSSRRMFAGCQDTVPTLSPSPWAQGGQRGWECPYMCSVGFGDWDALVESLSAHSEVSG